MIPVHFGTRDRLLFGAYTPAVERRKRRGVVICNPWGSEALRAHRSLRFLGDLLAQHGLDVLRFDYSGTGDSFGDSASGRLATWVEDTELAIDELVGMSGAGRVTVLGLRLGSYVGAAAAAGRAANVERVVLWEPVFRGRDHLRELLAARARPDAVPPGTGTISVGGFPLTSAFRDDLAACSLDGLPGPLFRVLVVQSSTAAAGTSALVGKDLATVAMDAPPCWLEEGNSGAGALPVALLRKVAEWLN